MDELVSDIIIRTTEVDPKTNVLALFALDAQLDTEAEIGDGYEQFVIGSVADLSIKPLLQCDNDINIMAQSTGEVAIPIGCKLPDDDYLRRLNRRTIFLNRMQQSQDPGYVRLLTSGSLECVPHTTPARFVYKPDPNSGIFVQQHKNFSKSTNMRTLGSTSRRTFQLSSTFNTNSLTMHETHLVILSDSVKSIHCPYWCSTGFCDRPKPHNWPMRDTVTEIVRKGCNLVLASDVNDRNRHDTTQWRLSFSRAETLLIQTWNPVQKIVYHLLRYLRKKCSPVACVISSHHIKTLMLWNCEKKPSSFWKANVINISSDLLGRLLKHINDRHLPNYFIPQSNLFDVRTDEGDSFGSSYVAVVATLTPFTRAEILAKWFLENYIKVAAKQYNGTKSANMADDMVLIEHLNIMELMAWLTTFVDTFLADYDQQRAMEACLAVNNVIRRLITLCGRGKLDAGFCRKSLDHLPQIDIRSLDFFRSIIFMGAASQTDQFGLNPGGDSIGMVVEVLIRAGKINRSEFDQCEGDSALSYFNKATSLLRFVKCSTGVEDKLLLALSKAYFWKSLLCSDSGAVYCAVNAYLAAIFYQGKETKLALHCCMLIASKHDHLSCSSYKMQPQLLPIINAVIGSNIYAFETENESRSDPHEVADKSPSTDPFKPERFANCLLSKIHVESEQNRFDENEETSSCSGTPQRSMPDKNTFSSQFSTEVAKTASSSSSFVASKKTPGIETLLGNTGLGISSNISSNVSQLYVLGKSGETDSQECSYSPSFFVSDYEVDNCFISHKSKSDEFRHINESEISETCSSTGRSEYHIKDGHECKHAISDISTKTRVYVRIKCKDICQECQDVKSRSLERGEISLNAESGMRSEGSADNKSKMLKLKKSGKEMVYCREPLNLDMHIPLALRSTDNVDHKPKRFSNTRKQKSAVYSRADSQIYPPAENDPENDALRQQAENLSDKAEACVDQSFQNTYTNFSNIEKISDPCLARENLPSFHQLYGSVETTIRQDVVSALVKASVCHMTAFNKALQIDPDVSRHGDCAYPYMALYHFNCGHFQASLEICNDIIKQQNAHISDGISFNLICSPPFDLLLTHELKTVVNECRSSSEIMIIEARFLAAYLSIHCLMNLDRSVLEIARMLMLAYGILLRSQAAVGQIASSIFVLLRKKVLQRYRGIITEDIGNESLSVLENGVLTNVGIKHDGAHMTLYTERYGGWDNKDFFPSVNENNMSY